MLVCGVEITASDANICLLSYKDKAFNVPDCRSRSLSLAKAGGTSTDSIRYFHSSFKKLLEDYKVDEVVLIERQLKGKFAGTALGFKVETAIQLIEQPVTMIDHSRIKAQLKRNPLTADYEDLGLKGLQKLAFQAAYAYHNESLYPAAPE